MSNLVKSTLVIAFAVATGGAALADTEHHEEAEPNGGGVNTEALGPMGDGPGVPGMMAQNGMMGQAGMMGAAGMMKGGHHQMMHNMMPMMMQMHGGMMPGGMAQMRPHGGRADRMGMMDQDMMSMMRGSMMGRFDADADGDGLVSEDEAHGKLQAMHADADANGDGALSLEEFSGLHEEMTRMLMVDRFQHLDADGDGMVTAGEMTAPADRMSAPPLATPGMGDDGDMGMPEN
jgi:EF hand